MQIRVKQVKTKAVKFKGYRYYDTPQVIGLMPVKS